MSVQVKGSGTIGGLDEGLVVSGIVTSSTQINVGSNIKLGSAGIVTASNFKTGVSNLHDVGLTLSGGQLDIGSNIKAGNAGVITATAFHGSGANLTGISGFATALSSTPNTLLNECFKTTEAFTIGAGTSIKIESDNTSGNTAFTRLSRINVSTGATFHVSSGTTFIMNVLNVF